MADVGVLIHLLIWLLLAGALWYVVWWAIRQTGLPPPLNTVLVVVWVAVGVLVLAYCLFGVLGPPPTITYRR